MAVPGDLDLQDRPVVAFQLEAHDAPGRGRVAQRGPEAAARLVGALDVEVVGPGEARGGPLLGVRVLRVVEGERTEVGLAVLDAPVEDVHVAHEADDEGRRRPVEDLLRRADLLDAALVHHHHAVRHLERLLLVVGHEDAGEADLVVQPPQPAAQLLADLGVERPEGLVEEKDARLDREGAGEGDPLALAARQLRGQPVGEPVELDHPQEAHHLLADHRLRGPGLAGADAQAEGHVLEDAQVPEEGVVLEDEADAAVLRLAARRVLALEEDLAAVRALEPRDDAQEARLAGPRRPEERHELAVGDLQADVVHRRERAERLGDASNLDAHDSSRHSTRLFATRVTMARRARREATAKAAWNWYSL